VTFPRFASGLAERSLRQVVEKWSNRIVEVYQRVILPRFAFGLSRFSKTGQGHKPKGLNRWERYPLFK
jgi:hypothetical protein